MARGTGDGARVLRGWLEVAERRGWKVTKTGRAHLAFWPPEGARPIFTASTPRGGRRSIENARSQLRRAGLPV